MRVVHTAMADPSAVVPLRALSVLRTSLMHLQKERALDVLRPPGRGGVGENMARRADGWRASGRGTVIWAGRFITFTRGGLVSIV